MLKESFSKQQKTIVSIVAAIAVLIFILLLAAIVIYISSEKFIEFVYHDFKIELLYIFLVLIIALELGSIVFVASLYSNDYYKKQGYHYSTIFVNYFFMLLEAIGIMFLYLVGNFGFLNLYLVFILFGFHIFSYPKKLSHSLQQFATLLVPIILYWLLQAGKGFSLLFFDSLFFGGTILVMSLVFGTAVFLAKSHRRFKKAAAEPSANDSDKFRTKYFIFLLAAFGIFVFIPGLIDFYGVFVNNYLVDFSIIPIINSLILIIAVVRQSMLLSDSFAWLGGD